MFEKQLLAVSPGQAAPTDRSPVTLSSAEVYTNDTGSIPNNTATAIFDVREWPILAVRYTPVGVFTTHTVSAIWYYDAAGTQSAGSTYWITKDDKPIVDSVANEGPFVQFVFTYLDGVTRANKVMMRGRPAPLTLGQGVAAGAGRSPQEIVNRDYALVAAGATVSVEQYFTARGWATITFQADTAGVILVGRKHTAAGTWVGDYFACRIEAGGETRQIRTVTLPNVIMRWDLINPTAAAALASFSVELGPMP